MGRRAAVEPKFQISEFHNQSGEISWRVSGYLRNRNRVRENFPSLDLARSRRAELEAQWVGNLGDERIRQPRPTILTTQELQMLEPLVLSVGDEFERAVSWWCARGRNDAERERGLGRGVRLDEAVAQFCAWVKTEGGYRRESVRNLCERMRRFAGRAGNLPLRSMTPEIIKEIIVKRSGGLRNQGNDRRAIGRFFYWCMESPRKWVATNPVSEVRIAKPEHAVPEVYTVREVMRWLVAARRHRGGKFLSFIVLQFFGGLRPSEAMRLEPNQWNLVDAELSIRAQQTKTKRPRTTHLTPMAVEWLRVCPAARIYNNITSVEHWSELCKLARPRRVIPDGFRHTAISHYFRRTGSYGLTAEWADNTEKIIKDHYKGRVTSADSERFWCLYPTRQMRLHARNNSGKNGS